MTSPTRGRPRSFDRDVALDSAVRLFWQRGFEATSVRDLTEHLGIGAPSLYHAFGAKHDLYFAALDRYARDDGGFVDRALSEEPTARAAALRLLREGPERYTRAGLPTGCLIAIGDAGTGDPAVRAHAAAVRAAKVAALSARIRADRSAGRLPPEVDAAALAQFTFSTLNGLAQAARDGVGRPRLRRVARIAELAWH